ncbi:MAG: hypothetical protein J6A51_00885, partial [Clostridia bacterium]|nr:hypothetical protein [Clostridia bacterium]
MEPQKAKEVAVSNNALQNLNAESEKQEDGTYTATITFTIDNELTIDEADLTISVSTGDNSFTEKLQNTGKHTMTLTGLTTDDADIK